LLEVRAAVAEHIRNGSTQMVSNVIGKERQHALHVRARDKGLALKLDEVVLLAPNNQPEAAQLFEQ